MEITNELLAAYAEGNVSESERKAVRQYLIDHPDQLETVMMMMDEDYDIQIVETNNRSRFVSFDTEADRLLEELDVEKPVSSDSVLPLMSKAAQNVEDNLCAVRCEGYALRTFGVNISDAELESEAQNSGLLEPGGTTLYSIGQLSAKHGLFVSRKFNCSIDDIQKALKYGDIVIAVIDNTELWQDPVYAETLDRQIGKIPNHALIILSIDTEKNRVFLLNPGNQEYKRDYPLDVFLNAWNDSANYLIISNRSHYNPHPINLSDVVLDEEIIKLTEAFAENAHEVWAKARKEEGWSYDQILDDNIKTDPRILPFDLLSEKAKEDFRLISMESIKLLKKLGWDILKKNN